MSVLKKFTKKRPYRRCSRKAGCVAMRKQKQKGTRRRFRQRGGKWGMADFLPTTSWGAWGSPSQAVQFGPNQTAPPALANGGMYSGPQSTGTWASTPFPPTQWAHSLEAATGKGPLAAAVFVQQKPNDNFGASFSPAFSRK